jgi:hypothetical protein
MTPGITCLTGIRLTRAGPVHPLHPRDHRQLHLPAHRPGNIRFNACVEPHIAPRILGRASRMQRSTVVFSASDGSFDS